MTVKSKRASKIKITEPSYDDFILGNASIKIVYMTEAFKKAVKIKNKK